MRITVLMSGKSYTFHSITKETAYSANLGGDNKLTIYITGDNMLRVRSLMYLPIEIPISLDKDVEITMIEDMNYNEDVNLRPKVKIKKRKILWKKKT